MEIKKGATIGSIIFTAAKITIIAAILIKRKVC